MSKPTRPLAERLWRNVTKTDSCWICTATALPKGYARLTVDGRKVAAHRISWELHFGPIPPEMSVCHHCDNPKCVRPDHLFLGTCADNLADMRRKGRGFPPPRNGVCGERIPWAKLTDDRVREIRARYAGGGTSYSLLAREYGLTAATVGELIRRETWKHVA